MTEYYMSRGATRNETYHSTLACVKVKRPEHMADRSESFVEFHDASPCEWCHDVENGCAEAAKYSPEESA